MNERTKVPSFLGIATALGFLATAGLHATGYSSVAALARRASGELGALVPALWLSFSVDLSVVGVILGFAAWRPTRLSRVVFACAGFLPASAAGLQLAYLGFIPPTAILIALAVAAWATAILMRAHPEPRRQG